MINLVVQRHLIFSKGAYSWLEEVQNSLLDIGVVLVVVLILFLLVVEVLGTRINNDIELLLFVSP